MNSINHVERSRYTHRVWGRLDYRFSSTLGLALVAVLLLASLALGQEDDDELPEFLPGLVARYVGSDGKSHERRDEQLAFVWDDRSPDPRLPQGKFRARWQGYLLTQVPGSYQIRIHASGKVKLRLAGKTLLDTQSDRPGWLVSAPVPLSFGHHRLEVEFDKTNDQARLALFWSGPKFQVEPITGQWLFHRYEDTPDESFHRGLTLLRSLRCASCHEISGQPESLSAPALDKVRDTIGARWMTQWLTQKPAGNAQTKHSPIVRRMPHFSLTDKEAEAVVAHLIASSSPALKDATLPTGNLESGRLLLGTLGCLACHQVGQLGEGGLFGGGDLSLVAEKRPAQYFALWLSNPKQLNRDHRMPIFRLSKQERADLSSYLATLKKDSTTSSPTAVASGKKRELGKQLIAKHQCGACHRLPGKPDSLPKPTPLAARSNWQQSCAGLLAADKPRPGYALSTTDQQALRRTISSLPRQIGPAEVDGRQAMLERNCTNCHRRGSAPGIASKLVDVAQAHPELAKLLPALSPPALNSVGDKLQDKTLSDIITGVEAPRRAWLKVRMPKYSLPPEQAKAILKHLVDGDRIPDLPRASRQPDELALSVAGPRLVTADGFGCTSCHQVGAQMPVKVELNAHGPALSMLSERIRRPWYDRWVRNPTRIVPRMEMPAVQVPVKGALHGDLNAQLASVWHVLNRPGFEPPAARPVRVVRRANDGSQHSVVMTDNIEVGKTKFTKPLLVALPNRHNVLFDQQRNRLAGWWIGDAARQRTRGKYWYWESGGVPVIAADHGTSEIELLHRGKNQSPVIDPALPPSFDYLQHDGPSVEFKMRLHFNSDAGPQSPHIVSVRQSFTPLWAENNSPKSGFLRTVSLEGVPATASLRFRVMPGSRCELSDDRLSARRETVSVHVDSPRLQFSKGEQAVLLIPPDVQQIVLRYETSLPVDQYLKLTLPVEPVQLETLDVVPGFEVTRLPMPSEIMPLGFAWRKDGRLVIPSLKGRVWQATDTNGDHIHDRYAPIGDEYLQPYGVAIHTRSDGTEAIDIVDKTALLRLYDNDDDGFAERTETLVAGWGHTTDYHGWVVGLPRDQSGNYYVAVSQRNTPSQPEVGPNLTRGRTLKLIPREPTSENPYRYRLQTLTVGHRFPCGIARNKDGALMVTDNQGNFNPYNEINHITPGAHFGFINPYDSPRSVKQPKTGPSIALPHPWTRSVNGICFLETPPAVREKLGRSLFGPFEGHLVGCEYDTRRLVRISLQKVGDRYQGAAYPLSITPTEGQDSFLGPIVCQVSPEGDLLIGSIRDSAYGAGRNTGELMRVRIKDRLPAGIAEVRSTDSGLTIDFTQPIDPAKATDPSNYSLSSFRRTPTPAYGGADEDRRAEKIAGLAISTDARRVTLSLKQMRPGHVYELRAKNLTRDAASFFPDLAYFTLGPLP